MGGGGTEERVMVAVVMKGSDEVGGREEETGFSS